MASPQHFESLPAIPAGDSVKHVTGTSCCDRCGASRFFPRRRLATGELSSTPCECVECCQQYRTKNDLAQSQTSYTRLISAEQAKSSLNKNMQTIRSDQNFLRNALQLHGNTILGRWKKRSQEQKTVILQSALPGIETSKWPAFYHLFRFEGVKEEVELRKTFLLPYLSLDDFKSNPLRFLSLLYCRTKYESEDWVLFDVRQTKMGWVNGLFAIDFCKDAVQMYGPNYGHLVPWEKNKAHRWEIMGYPRAQLVIEAQSTLMSFLRSTVEKLLENVTGNSLSSTWQMLVNSGFRKSSEEETWTMLSNLAFLGPPEFSPDRLLDIAVARSANAEDHLWLLQTNGSYMWSEIRYFRQSRLANAIVRRIGETRASDWVGSKLSQLPMKRIYEWRSIVEECQHIKKQYQRFFDNIHPVSVIPVRYGEALGSLELLLINILLVRVQELRELLPWLRGFEDNYDKPEWSSESGGFGTHPKPGISRHWFNVDPLWWCLSQLTSDPENLYSIDSAMLFGFLDNLLGTKNQNVDHTRVDQRLLDELSDLGAIWELLRAVRDHRPVFEPIGMDKAIEVGGDRVCWRLLIALHRSRKSLHRANLPPAVIGCAMKRFERLSIPGGRKDGFWHQKNAVMHKALSDFWTQARKHEDDWFRKIGCNNKDTEYFISLVAYDTAPNHLEAIRKENENVLTQVKSQPGLEKIESGFIQTYWGPSASKTNGFSRKDRNEKIKLKTRPESAATQPDRIQSVLVEDQMQMNTPDDKDDANAPSHTIWVKPESFKVFMDMYPSDDTSENTERKCLLDWRKFVGAMTDAGFAASASGGSAVTFAHSMGGRIIFHRPHPIAKMDLTMLTVFGKRLKKWFGMDRESFELAPRAST